MRALLVVGLVGCARVAHVSPSETREACRTAIAAFASGEPARVLALPETCKLGDLVALGYRGTSVPDAKNRSTRHHMVRHGSELDVWTHHGLIVAIDRAHADRLAEVRHAEPVIVMPAMDDAETTQYVWLERGIAVLVGPRDGDVRARLFAPVTQQGYERKVQYVEHLRDRPKPPPREEEDEPEDCCDEDDEA